MMRGAEESAREEPATRAGRIRSSIPAPIREAWGMSRGRLTRAVSDRKKEWREARTDLPPLSRRRVDYNKIKTRTASGRQPTGTCPHPAPGVPATPAVRAAPGLRPAASVPDPDPARRRASAGRVRLCVCGAGDLVILLLPARCGR